MLNAIKEFLKERGNGSLGGKNLTKMTIRFNNSPTIYWQGNVDRSLIDAIILN